jgi:peptidoglycan/xylan/chitin deacetylase (PgdA/CDA1 family)
VLTGAHSCPRACHRSRTHALVARIVAAVAAAVTASAASRPLVLPQPLPGRTLAVPILMYHRVGPEPDGPAITDALTVPSGDFLAEMEWLHRSGFHAITQRQLFLALERGAPLPPHPVLLTFDDGYRDVLWNAAPVLRRLRMPATAYVITGRIDGRDPSFLTWDEIDELQRDGFDIGSHTVHHVELPYLSREQAWSELDASRRTLERHLGHPVQWFSYPAGAEDPAVLPLVERAGYVLAVTTHYGEVQSARHPLELKRYEVLDTTGVGGLRALLLGR